MAARRCLGGGDYRHGAGRRAQERPEDRIGHSVFGDGLVLRPRLGLTPDRNALRQPRIVVRRRRLLHGRNRLLRPR